MPFGFPEDGSIPGDVFRVDSIEAVGSKLTTIDASPFDTGSIIYVGNETFPNQGSIQDYVRVRRDAVLDPEEGEVWNSATTGVQFERLHTPSHKQLQKDVWTLTQNNALGTAIIDNDGFGSFPISMRELNRRRAGDSQGIGSQISILTPSMNAPARPELLAVRLSNWWGTDGNASVVLQGINGTPIYSGTVVSFAPAVHGANTGYILEAVGIGTAFADAGLINALVQKSDQSKSAIVISEGVDEDHVRVSQPRNGSAQAFNAGSVVSFVAGETVVIQALPVMPIWPFLPQNLDFPAAGNIDFSGLDAQFNQFQMGDAAPFLINCLVNSLNMNGGTLGSVWSTVGWRGFTTFDKGALTAFSNAFGDAGDGVTGRLNLTSGATLWGQDNMDLENCQVLARNGKLLHAGDLSCFNFAGSSPAMLRADSDGWLGIGGDWWGDDNDCRLAQLSPGTTLSVPVAGISVATSVTEAEVLNIIDGGPGLYPRNAISVANRLGGGAIDPTIGKPFGTVTFTGGIVTSNAATTLSFMANPGSLLIVANQTSPQLYPASRTILRSLSVTKRFNNASANIVVTVYIAGGTTPTAMTVTILAADPVGTQYTYDAVPIILGAPQDFDVRMSAAIDAAPGTAVATATVVIG